MICWGGGGDGDGKGALAGDRYGHGELKIDDTGVVVGVMMGMHGDGEVRAQQHYKALQKGASKSSN